MHSRVGVGKRSASGNCAAWTFQLKIPSDAYDDGYQALVDKDGLADGLSPPSYKRYLIKRPTEAEYDTLVNEFWWNATYVPKYLWRDELPFAASMLGQSVRDTYLRTIIEWYIGCQYNWDVNAGVCGKRFKSLLDADTWAEYESTFATAHIEQNWQAFFNALALFRRLAVRVGKVLGFDYPVELDRRMVSYYRRIRMTERNVRNEP